MPCPRHGLLAVLLLLPARLAAQGLTPEQSLARMRPADGLEVRIAASEPVVRQPVTMTFDDRGRMWVIQYLQYPNPTGLKPVKVDQYLRTTYDRVPEPPPRGPKGADRVTILDGPDGSGRLQKAKDFVGGLNLASGLCLGHGGAFVLQVPYLLFYPDRDGDDAPDGDPQVLLEGFGMEDAHAVANSLQWGPDGWLYGAQGSTVTAHVRGQGFQQGVWRYHPVTKEFELFSEGGGNTWGLDFDAQGHVIAGTNYGGKAMLHQMQGAYHVKGFGKHGPLHNPHTYGYFEHVPCKDFQGGHVTIGGIVYRGGLLPARFKNQYIAGNLLSNVLYWYTIERQGSTFTSRHAGEFLVTSDPWFRPVDCLTGPDGAVYVADWHDVRANHVDPVDNWDRTNGRIYRVGVRGQGSGVSEVDAAILKRGVGKLATSELVKLLEHRNDWFVREARRVLTERRDVSAYPTLRKNVEDDRGALALESLWALYASGGFDDALAGRAMGHASEDVRAWAVRLVCDDRRVSSAVRDRLVSLARNDVSPTVRAQLACSAKRLPAKDGFPVVQALLRRDEDIDDPYIPLLLWWAVEDKAVSDRNLVLDLLKTPEDWRRPLARKYLVERIGRRYMAEGGDADLTVCAKLLASAPGPEEVRTLVQGMEKALEGRLLARVPAALEAALARLGQDGSSGVLSVRFGVRLGSESAWKESLRRIADPKASEADRIGLLEVVSQAGRADAVEPLLGVWAESKSDGLRGAVLSALQPFPNPRITEAVLTAYPRLSAGLKPKAQALLCSRPASARAFLEAVDAGRVAVKEVPLENLQRVVGYKDDVVVKLVEKHWGKVGPLPAGEKIARIRAVNHSLNQKPGDPTRGHPLYTKHCATCHTLFDEGNKVGPELTGADRKNREFLLTSLIDPNAFIRPEYVSHVVTTKDGRSLTGLIAEATPKAVTLVNEKNERTVLAREKIEEMTPSPVSMMPEKILDPLSEQEIRDLMSYLQSR